MSQSATAGPAAAPALECPMPASFLDNPQLLAPRQTLRTQLGGGAYVLNHPEPLAPYARCVGVWLEHWALHTPAALAFAEPVYSGGETDWRRLNYGALRRQVGAVAQGLLNLQLAPGKPVVVLSDNTLDHMVLLLAAQHIGRTVCTVSSAYCRLAGGNFSRIHGILQTLDPALVYASDAAVYGPALRGAPIQTRVVFSHGAGIYEGAQAGAQAGSQAGSQAGAQAGAQAGSQADAGAAGATAFADLQSTPETPAVMQAFNAITPDTHAKFLLTSGSTGQPKVVINTHRMLCANQQMLAQTLRFLETEKPVLLDWLPWSHTFGGNHNTNMVLKSGGCMYIDDGRPLPGLIDKTLAHLRHPTQGVQPTVYFNVPQGFEKMLPALEADEALARRFLGPLRMMFYAGSGMPLSTWQRLQTLAQRVRGEPLWLTTSWGSTETAPANTFVNWHISEPGVIGLPMPGVSLKFVPIGGKLELRVKGDHIFPGYRNNPEATAAAFDDDGYYGMGDAGYLKDEADPLQGVVFNGRVAEDFKLTSGTWVSVGTLRVRVVSALAPYVQDVVITGHDRSEIGALVFLNDAARALPPEQVALKLAQGLRALKAEGGGSSQTPARLLPLAGGPNTANGEITDKGYVNQRLVLTHRAADVLALYDTPADPRVITP